VIAADTFGVFQGKILGKPRDETEARQMLEVLNGHTPPGDYRFTIIDTSSGKAAHARGD